MNRAEFEKLRFAYADGELDEHLIAEMDAYLRSSPEARALIEADRLLRESLARGFAHDRLPEGFASQAFARLGEADYDARGVFRSRWMIPLGAITAAAACLALWLALPLGGRASGELASSSADAPLIEMIEETHFGCVAKGLGHQCADLPRDDLEAIRTRMSEKLGMTVLVPDLSGQGCSFQTANYCGLPGRRGAHLIYSKDRQGLCLSVMTVEDMGDRFPDASRTLYHGRRYYALADRRASVVAWNQGGATYVLCAAVEREDLLELADPVRLAMAGDGPAREREPVVRLAAVSWSPQAHLPMTP
jgi:anti-sigma factor RsiW